MGICLIGVLDPALLSHWFLVILQVAVGLGFVIFVHELGHFAVAKACGVKCDKFFLGFDIGGYKISRKWGETEYGIGILPLGGYVKMMGQDDNPGNINEQLKESMASGANVETKEIYGPDGKLYKVDKRSYLAKSVPQRMAIISAGVVMNVIFAFVFATVAYRLGVPYNPSEVPQTAPGSPAWQADIRPGDDIVQIGDVKNPSFADLKGGVMLGDLKAGVPFTILRDGKRIEKLLRPEQESGLPRVGIAQAASLTLDEQDPVVPGSEADHAQPKLEGGDRIEAVDGQPVANYGQFMTLLAEKRSSPIKVTVRRGGKAPKNDSSGPITGGKSLDVSIEPRAERTLGLVMEMGRVVAVQEGSPAATAGIKAGDFIDRITAPEQRDDAGALTRDPLELPGDLAQLAAAGGEANLRVRRAAADASGQQPSDTLRVTLRKADRYEEPIAPNDPVAAASLGVAYRVLNVVARVEAGSPAEKAGMQPGDVITQVELVLPKDAADADAQEDAGKPIVFNEREGDDGADWPWFAEVVERLPDDASLKLSYRRGDETKTVELAPVKSADRFEPRRGFIFDPIIRTRVADTWGEAVTRGKEETVNALGMVYRFLSKLGTQIPVTELGGPLTIAQAAGATAFEGPGKFLTFLTMLSANLAVINFLPIPVLDGGHMAFLLWEGIRGKPAGEKFAVVLQTAGFVFIVSLMLFVFSLDIRRLLFT